MPHDRDASRFRPAHLAGALAGNSALSLLDQAVVSGTNFLAAVLVGRRAGLAELGLYALGFAVLVVAINIHASLVTAPYTFYVSHSGGRARRLLAGSALIQHAALCMVLLAVLSAAAVGAGALAPGALWMFVALAVCSPLVLLKEHARRWGYAAFNVRVALVIDVAAAVVQLGAMLLLARADALSAASAHAAIGAGAALPGLVWLALAWKEMRFRGRLARLHSLRAGRFGAWVLADQMFAVTSGYFSHWALAFVIGPAATGAFAACLNVVQLANPLIFGMGNILEPKASAAVAGGGRPALRRLVGRSTGLIALAMAPLAVGFLLCGAWIVSKLYGASIASDSPWLIPVLTIAAALAALNVAVLHGLRAAQQSQANLIAGVVQLAVTLTAALVGIPSYGLLAAAVAMAAGNAAALAVRAAWFVRSCREQCSVKKTVAVGAGLNEERSCEAAAWEAGG
jgi:O-antigen/teichoic acid export membrane protein